MAKTQTAARSETPAALPDTCTRRVVIEHVRPEINQGRFPIKRTPGERVDVGADIFADGHDVLAAVLRYRGPLRDAPWREVPMQPLGNDEWAASFMVDEMGEYEYTVESWIDRVETARQRIEKKAAAGQDVAMDLVELERLGARASDRDSSTTYHRTLTVLVDRERARYGAWYEMFPRSAGPDPTRSATFEEAAERLREIADMGFDVVYLSPIHPIGTTHRKGRNNALTAAPGDPGSPWAIGSREGGHMSVDPGLGTLDDFDRFVETARRHGLEFALDLAYQTSPDHPYVREHPEWFRKRPDGTIKYAENPPKKYEDIYSFDFESASWVELWHELRRIILFWIDHGVRIFRVDNPHTKPFRFWEWVLADVRARHPDAIFLAEAFTRPKVMRHLAKLGFNQSYTYFTWRNTRAELTEYFTELTQTEVREYLRPNLFANTPDILHEYLQTGGPPAFRVRLVLAATLGASYGIYSGFELCENRARPGTEEYLDSEKYQIRQWDWDRPGNIRELVKRVNEIRRQYRALHFNEGLRFYETDNPQLMFYGKSVPPADSRGANPSGSPGEPERLAPRVNEYVFVLVNLDPHNMQHGWVRVPIHELGIGADEPYHVEDQLDGARYTWRGEWNYVRLDPQIAPAHVFIVL